MNDTLRASMQDIIDEALKDKVFAGRELNLCQRLEIAKHLEGALTFHGYALAAHPVESETENHEELPDGIGASGTELARCPVKGCGASGMEHCSTLTGRDHKARWNTGGTK